jgi:sec-independent protein translocase protein TatA
MPCGRIGSTELLLIVLLIVVLFGAGRLPELGKGLGLGIRGFKKAMKEGDEPDNKPTKRGGSDQHDA